MQKNITLPVRIKAAQRRKRAVELRVKGLTYQRIEDVLREEMGDILPPSYNTRHAWEDVHKELLKVSAETRESAKDVAQLELFRLDKMLEAIIEMVIGDDIGEPDLRAVDRALKIMERRAKLLGLDKPSQVKVTDWRSEILELIRTGKITFDQARKELGESLARELIESGGVGLITNGKVAGESSEIVDVEAVAVKSSTQ